MRITAKVKVAAKNVIAPENGGGVTLTFYPDYADGRNAEWAVRTPTLALEMNVIPEVAENFIPGAAYTLTFEPEVSDG